MKKLILFFTLLASNMQLTSAAYNTRDTAVEQLAWHTRLRKRLKDRMFNATILSVPCVIAATALAKDNNKVGAFFGSLTLCTIFYGMLAAIRSGHYYIARYYFRAVYNKRIDYNNNLVKAFTVGAEYLPYALNDQEFIQYGLAAGFSITELANLARKSGRLELANQLKQ